MISSVSSRQTSILDLPNNLILLIFARISNTDCCNVARACKHFASLVDEVHKKRFVLKCWLDPSVCSSVGVVDDSLIIMGGSVYYDNTITEMRSRIVLQDLNTLNASTVIDGISFTEADKILFIDSVNGYFFGGNHNTGYSNRVFRYNIHTSHFDFSSPGSIAPSPRSAHSSVAIDGKIYIFGGWNLNTDFGDLWCFTPFKLKEETFFNDDLTTTFEPFDDSIESDSLFLIRDISEFDNAPRSENLFLDFSSWNTYRNIVSNFLRCSTSCLH